MYRCMSPGAIGIPLAWRDCLPLAKAAGFEGMDLSIEPEASASFYSEALAEHGLRPGGVGLPVNFREGAETFESDIAGLNDTASAASEAGATRFCTWVLPYSDDLPWKDNFKLHAERLGRAAEVLADRGCALGLEFLGPRTMREGHRYRFVRTLGQMLDLCEAVGPNAGLLLDSWHWYTSLGTCEDILELRPEQVVYVHINDAPSGIAIDRQKDSVRRLPGDTGVIDLAGFLGALRTIGYDGPVTPEPFVPELAALPPEEAARRAGEALLKVWSMPPRVPR